MKYTAHEVIITHMELSENIKQTGYPVLNRVLKLFWYPLFKKTPESIVRKWVDVVNGVVDYPRSAENILGCYVVDSSNDLQPLYEDTIKNIIPVPKLKCKCNSCDTAECMCPTIKPNINQYDVIIEGLTYSNKTITTVLKSGKVVEEKLIWVPKYDASSLFTGVQQVQSQVTRCSVDTLPCGCVKNTDENHAKLLGCGCIDDLVVPYMRQKYPALYNSFGYYKKDPDSEARKIYLFNSDGKKSRLKQVLVVFQSNGSDMIVPEYAMLAVLAVIDYGKKMYSPSYIAQDRTEAKRNFAKHKNEMIKYLNPIPYELASEISDPRKKQSSEVYIHPSLLPEEVEEEICIVKPEEVQNITNITYTTNVNEPRFLKVEVDGGQPDSPVSGTSTYQNNKLKGLGNLSGDKVEITVDAQEMQNWGQNASFTLDKVDGIIAFTQGYQFQPHTSLKVDLIQ